MSPAGRSRGCVGAEKAGCASGVGSSEQPRSSRWVPKPAFPSPASVTPVITSALRLQVPAPTSCSTRPPPPVSAFLSLRGGVSTADGEAQAPAPRPRPPPPALPTPSSRPTASAARGPAPRASCGGGGAERRQAQPGSGGGRGTDRVAEARREETWREGRSPDSGGHGLARREERSAHQAPHAGHGKGQPRWSPAVHAQSALPHSRPAAGRRGLRPPDPAVQTQVSGQREAAGSGDGWSWTRERGPEGGGRREDEGKRYGGGGWRLMENGVSSNYGALGAGSDLMNLDIKEYYLILYLPFTLWA